MEFLSFVHNNISVVQLKPTKKYMQRLLVLLAFASAKSALKLYPRSNFFCGWVPSPPKNVGSSGQMSWHRIDSAFFLRHGAREGKRRRACLRLAHAQVENEIIWRETAPGAAKAGGACVNVDCARSLWGIPHSHLIQTKSTFIAVILLIMVSRGVGGGHIGPPRTLSQISQEH